MIETRKYYTDKEGSTYGLPCYKVTEVGLEEVLGVQEIKFVKGNIEGEEFRQSGIITENLLAMLIGHLKFLNQGELSNRQTSIAITNLEIALMWIEERKRDRLKRGVLGTYKK